MGVQNQAEHPTHEVGTLASGNHSHYGVQERQHCALSPGRMSIANLYRLQESKVFANHLPQIVILSRHRRHQVACHYMWIGHAWKRRLQAQLMTVRLCNFNHEKPCTSDVPHSLQI